MCVHECTDSICGSEYSYFPDSGGFRVRTNSQFENGRCNEYGVVEHTVIKLDTFNVGNPRGHIGPLCNPTRIVIPDQYIRVLVNFPLQHPIDLSLQACSPEGFTLVDILYALKCAYERIYAIEEETATQQTFTFTSACECKVQSSDMILPPNLPSSEWDTLRDPLCSICRDDMTVRPSEDNVFSDIEIVRFACTHAFHRQCISTWISHGRAGHTCPLCRQSLSSCMECDGSGIKVHTARGATIPTEMRQFFRLRNDTDGQFGIHDYDLSMLTVEELIYNRTLRRLHVTMGVQLN